MSIKDWLRGLPENLAQAIQGIPAPNLTSTGSTQTDALLLPSDFCIFNTVASGTGCKLFGGVDTPSSPGPCVRTDVIVIVNSGANTLNIYPPVGGSISGNSTNLPFALPPNDIAYFTYLGSGAYVFSPGSAFFARTAIEVTAGVIPVNPFYDEGDFYRYGMSTSASDNTAALNNWFSVVSRGAKGRMRTGTYTCTQQITWNLATNGRTGMVMEGDSTGLTVLNLTTTSSPALKIVGGVSPASFYQAFRNFAVRGALDGVVVQVGNTDFSDAFNTVDFDQIIVNNVNNTANAVALQMNGAFNCRVSGSFNCGGTTALAALQLRQTQFSEFCGSCGNAAVGIYLTAGTNFGNVFHAMDLEVLNFCVKADSASNSLNTWIGGQFVWNTNGITSTAGGNYLFLNPNPGGTGGSASFADGSNKVGVIVPHLGIGTSVFGGVNVNPQSGDGVMQVNSVTGNTAGFQFKKAASIRWNLQRNNATESGANAGSDMLLTAFDDSGASLFNALAITRATGNVAVHGALGVNGQAAPAQSTGWGTPTGAGVVNNFAGSAATLASTGQAVAQLIIVLKQVGILAV